MLMGAGPSSGGAAYAPPLDALASKVLAAFATFRLFTGNAESVRVRESGGSTEADVGTLSAGGFDTVAFNAHVGANNGFAAKAYDQNATNNFTQGTAASQPQITTASGINSLAALVFAGNAYLPTANLTWTNVWTNGFEFWTLVRPTTLGGGDLALGARGSYNPQFYTRSGAQNKPAIWTGSYSRFDTTLTVDTNYLLRFYYHSGTWYCDVNGVTEATTHTVAAPATSAAPFTLMAGTAAGVELGHGQMACALLFKEALTAPEAAALTTFLKAQGGIA